MKVLLKQNNVFIILLTTELCYSAGHDPTSLYQPDINNIINVYCKNIMNLMIERKAIKNTSYLFSMVLPDNENEETIKPKYTAELPIIISKFCESIKGNKTSYPVGYAIKIHDVFFGRRVGDKETCSITVDLQPCGTEHPIFEENF
ncbi:hypothetical protein H8356DRAFT_1328530 [Neocallimastix lanati (nom. inval.)]|nr:hypothetical protein H8356DRAFT_1328530 [Neocallimastix sp. JGI-2020a]